MNSASHILRALFQRRHHHILRQLPNELFRRVRDIRHCRLHGARARRQSGGRGSSRLAPSVFVSERYASFPMAKQTFGASRIMVMLQGRNYLGFPKPVWHRHCIIWSRDSITKIIQFLIEWLNSTTPSGSGNRADEFNGRGWFPPPYNKYKR